MNNTFRQTIEVTAAEAKHVQKLLDRGAHDLHKDKVGPNSTYETHTAVFENGFCADISICTSRDDYFINPVLFDEEGDELTYIDAEYDFLGEYAFEYDDDEYIVDVVVAA